MNSTDPDWDHTLTRQELEAARGPLNGATATDTLPVLTCVECGDPLTGQQKRFCSRRCQKRSARRNGEQPAPRPTVPVVSSVPTLPGPFEQLAELAALLPDGWRVEATAVSVTVTWSA